MPASVSIVSTANSSQWTYGRRGSTNPSSSSFSTHQSSETSLYDPNPARKDTSLHNLIDPCFQINYPSPDCTFSPSYNKVSGILHLTFLKEFKCITSIEVGLRGVVELNYQKVKFSSSKGQKQTKAHFEYHCLCDELATIFRTEKPQGLTFNTDLHFNKSFSLSFPKSILYELPSSNSFLGSQEADGGVSRVIYQLYVRIKYADLNSCVYEEEAVDDAPECIEFATEIKFKHGPRPSRPGLVSMIDNKFLSHTYTLINAEKSQKLPRNVQLGVLVDFPKVFNVALGWSQVPVIFEFPKKTPVEKLRDTFELRHIEIEVCVAPQFHFQSGSEYKFAREYVHNKQETKQFVIDADRFEFNKSRGTYQMTVPLDRLLRDQEPIKAMDDFIPPMMDCERDVYLRSDLSVRFSISVANVLTKTQQPFAYNFNYKVQDTTYELGPAQLDPVGHKITPVPDVFQFIDKIQMRQDEFLFGSVCKFGCDVEVEKCSNVSSQRSSRSSRDSEPKKKKSSWFGGKKLFK
ncbi:unnamed protein product [Ambrosiozyma monospora]|uniref:Unnamed protein product n=1 Tax=Ambrosiozyma monospora TaxID=43982 RepID=A0ACB5TE95_AMBMO|nr:unnamed protein product [Ambrosiozyma monospora]